MILRKYLNYRFYNKYIRQLLLNKIQSQPEVKELEIEDNSSILIVSPHPDDELIYASGLLLNHPSKVTVLCLTEGKEVNKLRSMEFSKTMEEIGVRYVHLNNLDSLLHLSSPRKNKYLDLERYDYIVVPNIINNHLDHLFTTKIIRTLLGNHRCKIILYEDNGTLQRPTHFVDISTIFEKKKRLMKNYESQLAGPYPFMEMFTSLNKYRGILVWKEYAEFYTCLSSNEYLKLSKIFWK